MSNGEKFITNTFANGIKIVLSELDHDPGGYDDGRGEV